MQVLICEKDNLKMDLFQFIQVFQPRQDNLLACLFDLAS